MPSAERRRRKAKPSTTPPSAPTIPGHCSTSPSARGHGGGAHDFVRDIQAIHLHPRGAAIAAGHGGGGKSALGGCQHRTVRRMHLADWNTVPDGLRQQALDNMLARYRRIVLNPSAWDQMQSTDWDLVPQPIRPVAYREMVAYWTGFYHVGAKYKFATATGCRDARRHCDVRVVVRPPRVVCQPGRHSRHRACRRFGLRAESPSAVVHTGTVDVALDDEAYFNPWMATRFVAIWMSLMLDEAGGNLELAVRAYHRGIVTLETASGRPTSTWSAAGSTSSSAIGAHRQRGTTFGHEHVNWSGRSGPGCRGVLTHRVGRCSAGQSARACHSTLTTGVSARCSATNHTCNRPARLVA